MKHIVIGVAGHVDHGKTMLTKALTGIDTDRLPEEKRRGLTIEPGFASFGLTAEVTADLIDVPGHERFIKNMLAGVAGVDMALLVVAADEGVMPQTREHLDILRLLGVEKAVIALTKADLAEAAQLQTAKEQITGLLRQTPMQGAPVVTVSAVSGMGLAALRQALAEQAALCEPRREDGLPRLPVDRLFSKAGFGLIATGTLFSGQINLGDELQCQPEGSCYRVRGLQIHGQPVEQAGAGQRVAVNLAGAEKEQLQRGCWLAAPGFLRGSLQPVVTIILTEDAPLLKQRSRLRIHHGAAEVLGRALLLDDQLAAGHSATAQLLLEQPLFPLAGDILILRSYSPPRTIGRAVVEQVWAEKRKRKLAIVAAGAASQTVGGRLVAALMGGDLFRSTEQLAQELQLLPVQCQPELDGLLLADQLLLLSLGNVGYYGLRQRAEELAQQSVIFCREYHRRYPLRRGISRAELLAALSQPMEARLFKALLQQWQEQGILDCRQGWVAMAGFVPEPDLGQKQLLAGLLARLLAAGCVPQSWDCLCGEEKISGEQGKELLLWLDDQGKLLRLAEGMVVAAQPVLQALEQIRQKTCQQGFTLAQARDILGGSRKQALLILEYADQHKFTVRQGDLRCFVGQKMAD